MRSLKLLIEKNKKVWFYCGTEELQNRFLEQAEEEGLVTMSGEKPTSLSFQHLYGINEEGRMGYISHFIWLKSFHADNKDILRIDYDRFISGEDDYISHTPHMERVS